MRRFFNPRNVEESRCEIDVEDRILANGSPPDPGSTHEVRNLDVHFKGEGLALDDPELAEVVAVVRGIEDVSVVQLTKGVQLFV